VSVYTLDSIHTINCVTKLLVLLMLVLRVFDETPDASRPCSNITNAGKPAANRSNMRALVLALIVDK